jgi:hypothetical protein
MTLPTHSFRLVSDDSKDGNIGFYDSICKCKKCQHEWARDCFKLSCSCCKTQDHSMVMNGIEGFESVNKR